MATVAHPKVKGKHKGIGKATGSRIHRRLRVCMCGDGRRSPVYDGMLPSQLDVSVSSRLTAGRLSIVDVVRRASRHHRAVAGRADGRRRRCRRRRRRLLEEDGRLVGAEVLLVGQNVAPGRRRLAPVNQSID